MRDRKPFRLRNLTASHNLFMFSLSLWMVIETLSQVGSPACLSARHPLVSQHSRLQHPVLHWLLLNTSTCAGKCQLWLEAKVLPLGQHDRAWQVFLSQRLPLSPRHLGALHLQGGFWLLQLHSS